VREEVSGWRGDTRGPKRDDGSAGGDLRSLALAGFPSGCWMPRI